MRSGLGVRGRGRGGPNLHGVVDLLEVERLEDVPLRHDGDGVRAWVGVKVRVRVRVRVMTVGVGS